LRVRDTSFLESNIPPRFSPDERFAEFVLDECVHLDEGSSRIVHATGDGLYVVKVARTDRDLESNWIEITAYLYYESDRSRIAAVHSWSRTGRFLVMERLDMTPVSINEFEYPYWITDRKHSNIGRSPTGELKVCDYALVRDSEFGVRSEFA
jgi:hypothetical protein